MTENTNSFGRLARRIADWTTKSLFSALVLVGGLGFGREVIRWWHRDEPPLAADLPEAQFGLGKGPIEVAFGDLPVRLGRQTLVGDQTDALQSLRDACREALSTAQPWSRMPDEQELDLLDRLDKLDEPATRVTSAAEERADERLYVPVAGLPLVVGTRRLADADSTGRHNRVVLWGLAVPAGERQWTLCLFQGEGRLFQGEGRGSDAGRQTEMPLPADCRRLMALGQGGAEACAFRGTQSCDAYRRFFLQWQAEQHPADALHWTRTDGGGWYGAGVWHESGAVANSTRSFIIQLLPEKLGGCTGFLFVSGER